VNRRSRARDRRAFTRSPRPRGAHAPSPRVTGGFVRSAHARRVARALLRGKPTLRRRPLTAPRSGPGAEAGASSRAGARLRCGMNDGVRPAPLLPPGRSLSCRGPLHGATRAHACAPWLARSCSASRDSGGSERGSQAAFPAALYFRSGTRPARAAAQTSPADSLWRQAPSGFFRG
jgi:hypothetical protein